YGDKGVRCCGRRSQNFTSVFFFFQAEDGIRDDLVTGVQTCALPISEPRRGTPELRDRPGDGHGRRRRNAVVQGSAERPADPRRGRVRRHAGGVRVSTLVFLPAWNEAENLPAVLDELKLVLPEVDVLVVDDGSTDDTAAVARAGGAEVVSFSENHGLPAGIAAGYAYALKHDYELCGRVDADGQHPPAELERLLERVREGRCD